MLYNEREGQSVISRLGRYYRLGQGIYRRGQIPRRSPFLFLSSESGVSRGGARGVVADDEFEYGMESVEDDLRCCFRVRSAQVG